MKHWLRIEGEGRWSVEHVDCGIGPVCPVGDRITNHWRGGGLTLPPAWGDLRPGCRVPLWQGEDDGVLHVNRSGMEPISHPKIVVCV